MTIRLFLVPVEDVLVGPASHRGPKYFKWRFDPDPPALLDVPWSMRDFGLEPTALIAADVDTTQHALLAAQPDVTALPLNLDNQLGVSLATVQAQLEALRIPADNLLATHTYRQVVRAVVAIFAVAQRFNGRHGTGGRLFPSGITLATVLSDLPLAARQNLQAAAEDLGYDYSGLTLASSLREVLKKLASQQAPFTMLGLAI